MDLLSNVMVVAEGRQANPSANLVFSKRNKDAMMATIARR